MPKTSLPIERLLGPLPGGREGRAISVMSLIAAAVLCAISLYWGARGSTFLGRHLGGDYVAFHAVGEVANRHGAERIYDTSLAYTLQHRYAPSLDASDMLVFANAPHVAQVLRPFALLPYWWSYAAWLVFSLALALGSARLVAGAYIEPEHRHTALLLAVSSPVYIFETWIGGQLSVLGLGAVSLAFYALRHDRRFLAGAALGLLAYKPTLLVFPAAVLAIGACWRMLAGMSAAVAAAGVLSLATAGVAGIHAWIATMRFYMEIASGGSAAMKRFKYVDANAFLHMLLGSGFEGVVRLLAACAGATAAALLARAWWKARGGGRTPELLWCATFAGATIANVYVPIYDTVLLIPAIVAAYGTLHKAEDRKTAAGWIAVLYVGSWLTQSAAEWLRVQFLTILLAAFGYYLLKLAGREQNLPGASEAEAAPTRYSAASA